MTQQLTNGIECREPLAIVGIGLRLPMESNNVQEFWNNLVNGTDGITKVPKDRWNSDYFTDKDMNKAGKIRNCSGSFIKDVSGFDNEFFNLSPNLCHHMDPQQRLLLEVTFEALEDAGLKLKDVSDSETSVYVGSFQYDYYVMCLQSSARDQIGSQVTLGTSLTSLSNRISYHFNLKGPSVTLDTACSASLVGFHHACQSIWNGEAKMAIAGGVNVILRPETSIMLSKGGFLGPSGLCKSFDTSADGYVRGEGAAIVIIKPLQQALQNDDRIYALVEGTAISHDGYKMEGYSVPSIEAQIKLLSSLYSKTGIVPTEVDYIECHGTGTQVGDPIEVAALGQVIGKDRIDECYIGSVKTNIGHLEGAAGITGLIKAALVLTKKSIPPNLHFNNPRSNLHLQENHLRVPIQVIKLNKNDNKPILAGVNSFGAGGANAHVILSEFIPDKSIKKDEKAKIISNQICLLFLLSQKSESALKTTARKYIQYLKETSNNIIDICYTLIKRRSILSNQLLITAYSKDEIIDLLQEYIQGKQHQQIYTKQIFSDTNANNLQGKLAFVYSGQGGQWIGMSRQLMAEIPLFKSKMIEIDDKFKLLSGWSFIDEINNLDESTTRINDTTVIQPITMAIQICLTYIWKEYLGIKYDGVVGHSIGEVAAAYCSDSIDLDTAVFIIYHRSLIQHKVSGRGKMLAVGINEIEATQFIEKFDSKISIATMNGPRMLTIAGDSDILNIIAKELELKHIFNAFVKTEVPYHTSIMEEIREEMINSLKHIKTNKPNTELYSTVTATRSNEVDGKYWYENVRKPVLFVQTVEKMINDGYKQFIEIGPHPVLVSGIKQLFSDLKINNGLAICSIKRQSETVQLFQNLGIYYIHNATSNLKTADPQLNFQNFLPNAKFVFDLPHNTWEHKYFLFERNEEKQERLGVKYKRCHPFLRKDYKFHSIKNNQIWDANVNVSNATYLVDHVVSNAIVFPASGYIELAYAIGNEQQQERFINNINNLYCFLEDIQFETALILPEEKMKSIVTRLEIISSEGNFIIYTKSEQEDDSNWSRHTSGKINLIDQFQIKKQPKFNEIINEFDDLDLIDIKEFYSFVNNCGLSYGKYFQCIEQLWYNDSKILSKVTLSEDIVHEGKQYYFHPALCDAALHGLFVEHMKNGINELYLPHSLDKAIIYKTGFTTVYAYIEVIHCNEEFMKADTWIYDEDGELIAEFYGLTAKNLSKTQSDNNLHDSYEYKWIQQSIPFHKEVNAIAIDPMKALGNLILIVDDMKNPTAQQISKNLSESVNYKFNNIKLIDNEQIQLSDILITNQDLLFIIYIPSLCQQDQQQLDMQQKALKYLNLVKTIQKNNNDKHNIKLRLITHNSSELLGSLQENNEIKFDHILLCGMCRVIQNEYSNLNVKFIDINENNSDFIESIFDDLFDIRSGLQDNEIMYRNGIRYVRRLDRLENEKIDKLLSKELDAVGSSYHLEIKEKGILDSLEFRQNTHKNLLSNEIEIEVHAAGINFKDVLNILGRLSDKSVRGSTGGNLLGLEISGIITAKGSNVNCFDIGDEVMAGVANGFSGRAVTSDSNCMKKPKFLSHVQGATIPAVYMTAYYGLKHLARINSEDTILIHSATGGVGIACINVSKYFGAKIIATVGSKIKREFLEKEFAIESKYIFDSHSASFYNDIMNITNGQGVDIVINSLSGSLLDQSIKCLNSFGRFIEIGKTDIYENKPLYSERFGNNISYFVEDIDRLSNQKPILHKQMMNELEILFQQGYLKPIPYTEYSINQISLAFQYMMKGNHIGKLVVNMENQIITALPERKLMLSNDGVFIISGGTNGLGLMTAKWIIEKGIHKLVLISRNGIKSKRDEKLIDELKSKGVSIDVKKVDIKSNEEVEKLFSDVYNNSGIIRGVIHSAAILSDSPIEKITEKQFIDVIQTKVFGALNLHNTSLKYSNTIQYFIMFSSMSSVIGNIAQINYAAANYFLDILAEYRKQHNLPCTSINLGLLGEYAGMSNSRNDFRGIGKILINQGIMKMPLHAVLNHLELAILHKSPSRVTAVLDWKRLNQSFPAIATDLRFREIMNNLRGNGKTNLHKGLREKVAGAKNNTEAVDILKQEICLIFSKILSLSGTNIDVDQPIDKLGFDSLSYTQVRTWFIKNLDISYPIIKLMKGVSIQTLAEELIETIKVSSTDPSESQMNINDDSWNVKHSQDETKSQTTHCNQKHSIPKQMIKPSISILRQEAVTSNPDNETKSTDQNYTDSVSKRVSRSSLSLMNAHILGIGTSNPAITNYTTEVFKNITPEYKKLGISNSDLSKITSIYANCGVEKKYCHADFTKKSFTENAEDEYFNDKYKRIAPGLAFTAASKAIQEWGGDVKTISHVVSCSCTGILVPDINFLLIKEFGLNNNIERISVNMMGCFGGLSSLKTAKALALQKPDYRILMVCTELCSLHYRPSLQIDTILACAIFGDGSAAMIIGCNPTENEKRIYEIIETGSHHIPNTTELMSWDLTKDGWIIGLSPSIPLMIGDISLDVIKNFLNTCVPFSISLDNCDWLIHPGGKSILLSLQEALNIPHEKNISAWTVLQNYGNMSSATVLFVMDDARKRASKEEFSLSLAFGPGLSIEIALLRKL